jgi:hypothetical protein
LADLALAQRAAGQADASRRSCRRLDKLRRALIRANAADPLHTNPGMDWQKRLEVELLSTEVQAHLGR